MSGLNCIKVFFKIIFKIFSFHIWLLFLVKRAWIENPMSDLRVYLLSSSLLMPVEAHIKPLVQSISHGAVWMLILKERRFPLLELPM